MEDSQKVIDALMQSIATAMNSVPARDATAPFGPPPWPLDQMTAMVRHLCNEAGLPARCPDRHCQRARCCQGGLGEGLRDSCAKLWDEAQARAVNAAVLALAFGWACEMGRLDMMNDWLEMVKDGALQ